jgi:CheY-like chemotaxis protein
MAHDRDKQRDPHEMRSFRILVVEDNPHVVEMYEYALRKLGAQGVSVTIEYAGNGHDALARLAEPPGIDLVMADLYMPVMDGFALIERMRATPALAAIPILVISAGAADAKARAMGLGVDFYLEKPVKFADVVATVGTLLRIG